MTGSDSLLFLIFGFAMEAIPRIFPGWFPNLTSYSTSTRVLWLEVMGFVQGFVAAVYFVREYVAPVVAQAFSFVRQRRSSPAGVVLADTRSAHLF